MCESGKPVFCGDTIRLEHMETKKNLHSHNAHSSPISGNREVSGFGDDGDGDNFDNWILECLDGSNRVINDKEKVVKGDVKFQLKHAKTNGLLQCESRNMFNHRNCPRCPIIDQLEAST